MFDYKSLTEMMIKTYLPELIIFIDSKFPNRKYKYSTQYVLEQVCYILQSGICYKYLTCEAHCSTIAKRFQQWVKLSIFKTFSDMITNKYIEEQLCQNPLHFKQLYIDASLIKNRRGHDSIGFNFFDRNRKASKVSIICDNNEIPLASIFTPGNVHDSQSIEACVKELQPERLRINNRFSHVLIGDTGYVKNKEFKKGLFNKYRVTLIHTNRVNQKSDEEKLEAENTKVKAKDARVKGREDRNIKATEEARQYELMSKNDKKVYREMKEIQRVEERTSKTKEIKARVKRLKNEKEEKKIAKRKRQREKVKLQRSTGKLDLSLALRLNTKSEIKHLKTRYKIEHVFCRYDGFKRIRDREESLIKTYTEFHYLATMVITINFLSKY